MALVGTLSPPLETRLVPLHLFHLDDLCRGFLLASASSARSLIRAVAAALSLSAESRSASVSTSACFVRSKQRQFLKRTSPRFSCLYRSTAAAPLLPRPPPRRFSVSCRRHFAMSFVTIARLSTVFLTCSLHWRNAVRSCPLKNFLHRALDVCHAFRRRPCSRCCSSTRRSNLACSWRSSREVWPYLRK